MTSTQQLIESLLFISSRPLSTQKLRELTGRPLPEVEAALAKLMDKYRDVESGVLLQKVGTSYQFATSPNSSAVVQLFFEEEDKKELTKPSLETLTIIAYRGPITKLELETIRGVHCGLILRNLLVRGLIEPVGDKYQVTFDFLNYLGLREVSELPDFSKLNANEHLQQLLTQEKEEVE